jgi:hypothetical protein
MPDCHSSSSHLPVVNAGGSAASISEDVASASSAGASPLACTTASSARPTECTDDRRCGGTCSWSRGAIPMRSPEINTLPRSTLFRDQHSSEINTLPRSTLFRDQHSSEIKGARRSGMAELHGGIHGRRSRLARLVRDRRARWARAGSDAPRPESCGASWPHGSRRLRRENYYAVEH